VFESRLGLYTGFTRPLATVVIEAPTVACTRAEF